MPKEEKPQSKEGQDREDREWSEECQTYCDICPEKHLPRACSGRRGDDEGEFQPERW